MMVHTDMPGYPAVLRAAARILRPGGVFVHVGVHPCFCGGFADRADPDAVKSWRRAAVSLGTIADGSWFVESTEHRQARAYPSREVAEQIARQVMAACRWDAWTEIPPDQPPPALG